MLLMSVAYNFFLFTTRPTILLLVYLPLNSITNTKTVIQWNMMINNFVQMANYKLNSKDKITYTIYSTELAFPTLLHTPYGEIKITYKH